MRRMEEEDGGGQEEDLLPEEEKALRLEARAANPSGTPEGASPVEDALHDGQRSKGSLGGGPGDLHPIEEGRSPGAETARGRGEPEADGSGPDVRGAGQGILSLATESPPSPSEALSGSWP